MLYLPPFPVRQLDWWCGRTGAGTGGRRGSQKCGAGKVESLEMEINVKVKAYDDVIDMMT